MDVGSSVRQQAHVFLIWHSFQVIGAVIGFDAVDVMDVPAWGQGLIVCLFPYDDML